MFWSSKSSTNLWKPKPAYELDPLLDKFIILCNLVESEPNTLLYSVMKKSTQQVKTARIFKKSSTYEHKKEYLTRLRNEISISSQLEHRNILKLLDVHTYRGLHFIITDGGYFDGLGMLSLGYIKPETANPFIWDLLEGLQFLHKFGIAHLNLKLENIVMFSEGTVKISDFGNACHVTGQAPPSFYLSSSTPYSSPEFIKDRSLITSLFACDIWAAGIIAFIFLTGIHPWEKASSMDSSYHWYETRGSLRNVATTESIQYNKLLLTMLHPDPARRSNIDDALSTLRSISLQLELPALA